MANNPHLNACAIVGIGATEFSRNSGRSELTLATEAAVAAAADAGVAVSDIDGMVRCDMDFVQHNALADALGLPNLSFWSDVGVGGGAPAAMVGQAVAAIMSGQASTVLVYRALNGRTGARYGQGDGQGAEGGGGGSYLEYFSPYGLNTPGQMWSMLARRHMVEFGTTSEHLAHIAMTCRENANANPLAQMHGRPMTMDDYLASPMLTDPLRLFDYCIETDGAVALIVTSLERARDLPQPPAVIRAVAQGVQAGMQPGIAFPSMMRASLTTMPSAPTAARLYARAGMTPADIDVAQFYDCFTMTALIQLEDYGFCAKGEGGPFAASGAIRRGGSIPINTAGGHLSEGYLHGVNHILEGVRQIRGTSTSQVEGAEVSLVTSGLPIATSAMILTKGVL
ncbi:thiolase C-terminal domain-containing protein [Granulicoccus phenolivorans]|uniref:thiolase C-terminal domain-containing protein n=1 Tax=Granulicoccus phenolivorans TaxID=266854 RepID=UPI00041C00AC|nr:lipid-transfer protein [Granulicoccus phenolivorans]